MIAPARQAAPVHPAVTRLTALAPLDAAAVHALDHAIERARPVRARYELMREGKPAAAATLIVSGWAARVRIFPDGQRQFLSFLLPGDLIGLCRQPQPLAVSTVIALSDLLICTAPSPDDTPALGDAYAMSAAVEEAYLLDHIGRLGRLTAQERIADLLLELHERLTVNGMAADGEFDLPLTQEMLGDALGLTAVHINRMVQQLRSAGDIVWKSNRVRLCDPAALARKVGRTPVRVSAGV